MPWRIIGIVMICFALGTTTVLAAYLVPCGPKSETTGNAYGIKGSGINVRKGPGTNYQKIINQKATGILGKTVYAQIDYTVTVRQICHQDGWSRVEVLEPNWLTKSHSGWIASRFLRGYASDASGRRVFTEDDFIWDSNIRRYKDVIIAGVNKVHRENRRCQEIDPASAYISKSKSKPGNPVFFVTCGSSVNAFNVFFSQQDVEQEKTLSAARHIDRNSAVDLCEDYVKSVAAHPSTVDFSRLWYLSVDEHPNGRTTVTSKFSAKNNYNLKLMYDIRCLLDVNGFIEAHVTQAK